MAPKAKAKKGPLVSQQRDNRLLSQSNTTQRPSSLQPHSTAEGGAKESTINLIHIVNSYTTEEGKIPSSSCQNSSASSSKKTIAAQSALKTTGLSSQSESESESESDANAKDDDDSLATSNLLVPRADWEEEDEDISLTSDLNAKNTTAAAALHPSNNNGTKKKSSAISKVPIILYDAMVEKLDGKSTSIARWQSKVN
jgi:hypothetical protein